MLNVQIFLTNIFLGFSLRSRLVLALILASGSLIIFLDSLSLSAAELIL